MIRRKNLLIFSLIVLCGAFAACSGDKHSISAKIEGLGNDTVFVEYLSVSDFLDKKGRPVKDTILASNNKFVYNIPGEENTILLLEPSSLMKTGLDGRKFQATTRLIHVIAKSSDKLEITGSIKDDYINYNITGTKFNEAHSTHREISKEDNLTLDKLGLDIDQGRASKINDSILKQMFSDQREIYARIAERNLTYIKENPESDLSAYYLTRRSLDSFDVYYANLSEEVKTGMFKRFLEDEIKSKKEKAEKLKNKETVIAGADAPDFTLVDTAGKEVSLHSLKGKYIVLDFWGSWCGWCVKGYPEMKKYYEKYNDKVEFVGIACADRDMEWRRAIEDNKLNWIQLFNNEKDVEKNASVLYAIQGYPTKILLDKDLKIVEIFVGEVPAFYKKLDEVLN